MVQAIYSTLILVVFASFASLASAQYPVGPDAAPPSQSPEYSYHHASTYIEGLYRGRADLRRAHGEYNYNSALALRHREEAKSRQLDNRLKQAETFFEMRALNRQARANERRPPTSASDSRRYAHMNAPRRLTSAQYDAALGLVTWPHVLTNDYFDRERLLLDRLIAARTPHNSGQGSMNHQLVGTYIGQIQGKLKLLVHQLPPADYASAKAFLQSLQYESQLPLSR